MSQQDRLSSALSEVIIYQLFYVIRPDSNNTVGAIGFKNNIITFAMRINKHTYGYFDGIMTICSNFYIKKFKESMSSAKFVESYMKYILPKYLTKKLDFAQSKEIFKTALSRSVIEICKMCESEQEDLYYNSELSELEAANLKHSFAAIFRGYIIERGYNLINPDNTHVSKYQNNILVNKYAKLKEDYKTLEKKNLKLKKKLRELNKKTQAPTPLVDEGKIQQLESLFSKQ